MVFLLTVYKLSLFDGNISYFIETLFYLIQNQVSFDLNININTFYIVNLITKIQNWHLKKSVLYFDREYLA